MAKICIVSTSAALPGEKGLNRMFYIATMLKNNGNEVDFITSDFQHWEKKHRNVLNENIEGVNVIYLLT